MDAFVLLFTLAILLALGMPVAFAVGLSAVAGALWIDLPPRGADDSDNQRGE